MKDITGSGIVLACRTTQLSFSTLKRLQRKMLALSTIFSLLFLCYLVVEFVKLQREIRKYPPGPPPIPLLGCFWKLKYFKLDRDVLTEVLLATVFHLTDLLSGGRLISKRCFGALPGSRRGLYFLAIALVWPQRAQSRCRCRQLYFNQEGCGGVGNTCLVRL